MTTEEKLAAVIRENNALRKENERLRQRNAGLEAHVVSAQARDQVRGAMSIHYELQARALQERELRRMKGIW